MSASVASIDPISPALPATAAAGARVNRLALLDTTRVIAAFGIVWVHTAASSAGIALHPIGTFGVPFYTFIALLFMARALSREPAKPLWEYVRSRFFRVYVPFLFWSLTYLVLGNVKAMLEHQQTDWLDPTTLYCGDEEHLWFLPFLMVVTIVGAVLYRGLKNRAALRYTTAAILIACGAAACFAHEPAWIKARTDDYYFFHYAFRALPTVFWSIALALLTVTGGKLPRTTPLLAVGGFGLLAMALLLQPALTPLPILRSLAGLGCVLLALYPLASPLVTRIAGLGRHSYGIYLSHMVFVRVLQIVVGHLNLRPTLALDLLLVAIAFASASVLSIMLGRTKWTSWAIGE